MNYSYTVIQSGSKFGVHTQNPNGTVPFVRTQAAAGSPLAVVKSMGNLGVLLDTKAASPSTTTILRYASGDLEALQGLDKPNVNIKDMARNLFNYSYNQFMAANDAERKATDYIEICNEPDPNDPSGKKSFPDGYRRLGQVMIECMNLADAKGVKLALLGLPAGVPEYDEMLALISTGMFTRARQGGHILALHEGVFGDSPIWAGYGDLLPGAPVVPFGAGSMCFRYRYLYSLIPDADKIPLVISEFYPGSLADNDDVAARYAWYDSGLKAGQPSDRGIRADYYVLGVCCFTLGPLGGWKIDDHEKALPAIGAYRLTVRGKANGLPMASQPTRATVIANAYNKWRIRQGPGTDFASYGAAAIGTTFPILDTKPGALGNLQGIWYKILPEGFEPGSPAGWISSTAVSVS